MDERLALAPVFLGSEELVDWIDGTIEALESEPTESRIYSVEQHG
jgi:hypothetical protein